MDNGKPSNRRKKPPTDDATRSVPAQRENVKPGRRGERTPLELETKAKMMLALGYTAGGTAKQLGLAKETVRSINERMTAQERKEWSQRYRTWAANELLPEVKERLMEALPNAKAWELNNILGTAFDKLSVLEGRPSEIHGLMMEHRLEIVGLAERLARTLPAEAFVRGDDGEQGPD